MDFSLATRPLAYYFSARFPIWTYCRLVSTLSASTDIYDFVASIMLFGSRFINPNSPPGRRACIHVPLLYCLVRTPTYGAIRYPFSSLVIIFFSKFFRPLFLCAPLSTNLARVAIITSTVDSDTMWCAEATLRAAVLRTLVSTFRLCFTFNISAYISLSYNSTDRVVYRYLP